MTLSSVDLASNLYAHSVSVSKLVNHFTQPVDRSIGNFLESFLCQPAGLLWICSFLLAIIQKYFVSIALHACSLIHIGKGQSCLIDCRSAEANYEQILVYGQPSPIEHLSLS